MARARGACSERGWKRDVQSDEIAAAGQCRAIEQQAAVAALFPQHVVRGLWRAMFGGRLGVMARVIHARHRHRHVHAHRHRSRGVLIHRHRLRNQWADEDHQHGEQGEPAAASQVFNLTALPEASAAQRAHRRSLPQGLLGVRVGLCGLRRFLLHRDVDGDVSGLLEMQRQRKTFAVAEQAAVGRVE